MPSSSVRAPSPSLLGAAYKPCCDAKLPQSPPPIRRPLKRSTSTASLPTPPRTRRDRERRRSSRESSTLNSSSEDECEEGGTASKRRKIVAAGDDDDEEAFWMGSTGHATVSTAGRPEQRRDAPYVDDNSDEDVIHESERSPSPDAIPLCLLKKAERQKVLQASGASSLASPPPSRRVQSSVAEKLQSASPPPVLALPVTPRQTQKRPSRTGVLVVRDSPDNPFLDNGSDDGEDRLLEDVPLPEEKPTVTYVFRGKKTEFHNPHYDAKPTLSRRDAKHRLPLDHPDYSPDARCPPKRLFTALSKRKCRPASVDLPGKGANLADEDDPGATTSEDEFDLSKSIARKLFDTASSSKDVVHAAERPSPTARQHRRNS